MHGGSPSKITDGDPTSTTVAECTVEETTTSTTDQPTVILRDSGRPTSQSPAASTTENPSETCRIILNAPKNDGQGKQDTVLVPIDGTGKEASEGATAILNDNSVAGREDGTR